MAYEFRDPDGTLRLDEALGERYVAHYVRVLESAQKGSSAASLAYREPEAAAPQWHHRDAEGELIVSGSGGELVASSCTALATWVAWDVCGYYADLGIGWRMGACWRATKAEIRRALTFLDPRQSSERLFYAARQLLDPVIRRAYDAMPFGGAFLGDRGIQEAIERKAARQAAAENASLGEDEPVVSYKDKLLAMGFQKTSNEEARERLAGQPPLAGAALGSTFRQWARDWSYYLLPGEDGQLPYPLHRDMEAWQGLVIAELSRRGMRVMIAVGAHTGDDPIVFRDGKEGCIIFLMGTRPVSQEMAREAVEGHGARVQGHKGQRN